MTGSITRRKNADKKEEVNNLVHGKFYLQMLACGNY
jgi:hypothetical protein